MKSNEVFLLSPCDKIQHKHYGVCTVKEVMKNFGAVVIEPDTEEGKKLLSQHSGAPLGTPLLENHFRLISKP